MEQVALVSPRKALHAMHAITLLKVGVAEIARGHLQTKEQNRVMARLVGVASQDGSFSDLLKRRKRDLRTCAT